jgi:hypothetical protein
LWWYGSDWGKICSSGDWSENFNENNKYNVGDNTVVEVEADMEKKVIFYFIILSQTNKNQFQILPLVLNIQEMITNTLINLLLINFS